MAVTVSGAAKWRPAVAEGRADMRLDYQCPTCHVDQSAALQALPWSTPVVADGEDASGLVHFPDTAPSDEVTAWEQRRADGKVRHETAHEVTTQIWCHRCQQGADVTVALVDADVER